MARRDRTDLTEAILESICDGVFTVDADWRISSFNRAAERITGIRREEAIGQPCSEVFRCSLCENHCALRETLHSNKPIVQREGFIIRADGQQVPISISTAVLRDASGRFLGGAETFRDLSDVEALRQALHGQFRIGDLVSRSPRMQPLFELLPTIAASRATVLIEGETGTGKELLARAIHGSGSAADAPFVAINCGALPDNLLESELFGYKKGAFTGALQDKPGRLHRAGQGTLFLDEIGEISPALQVRLLRVLQERQFEPLGATDSEPLQARIIAATHRDLAALVAAGRFRQDLFYRIHVVNLKLPPLRDRLEDIPLLVDHFITRFNRLQKRHIQGCRPTALAALVSHDWPGNVRELENVIERAFVLCQGDWIERRHLPAPLAPTPQPGTAEPAGNASALRQLNAEHERQTLLSALQQHGYNRQATAAALGIHKTTLYRKIQALGLELPAIDGRRRS
ncbi:MAG: sigma-54 interaction domain-containing protein [Desulfuromonas sp.]|jgi:PAS domain S-box-containing protein|nr:sigma 54-interacting transcriptional regulator [Desulfuromonas thiophila]MDD3800946.1 sigma 54-interacting transcriptional regulator [Desulfuromonas thiophila]MDY0397048.1 sigma 54-interacting transcriptional regulator [Desulfuromonas thiophila]